MNKVKLNKYLNNYSKDILEVDRLLVSCFLYSNNINLVQNNLIDKYQTIAHNSAINFIQGIKKKSNNKE